MFQVKHFETEQGDHSDVTHFGQSSSPHFLTATGVGKPASSQRFLSTDCDVLCNFTKQWIVLNWKPFPPHVWEHFVHSVAVQSNFKFSGEPLPKITMESFSSSSSSCIVSGNVTIRCPRELLNTWKGHKFCFFY